MSNLKLRPRCTTCQRVFKTERDSQNHNRVRVERHSLAPAGGGENSSVIACLLLLALACLLLKLFVV
jgi:hypothetical protein